MQNYFITINRVSSFISEILRKLEFCKKTWFYHIPMGFTTVTHVYHVDKAQLRLTIDQCTWNLHNSQWNVTQYVNGWFVQLFLHWTCHRSFFVQQKTNLKFWLCICLTYMYSVMFNFPYCFAYLFNWNQINI